MSDGFHWNTVERKVRRPFGTGNILGLLATTLNGAGVFLGGTFRGPRFDVIQAGPITSVQFLFTNFGGSNLGGPTALTVGCTIELSTDPTGNDQSTSQKFPLTFAGKLTTVIEPNGYIWSDPLNLDMLAGTYLRPRTFMTVSATGLGFAWTFASSSAYGEGGDWDGVTPPDKRATGTITVNNNQTLYGPCAARGLFAGVRRPVFFINGDSIPSGTGDSGLPGENVAYNFWRGGWVMRGLNGRVPVLQSSRGGETTALNLFRPYVRVHADMADHSITGTGVNDLLSITAAALQADFIVQWQSLRAMGPLVWQPTITPRPASSSDGWVTVEGQTVDAANNPKRVLVNAWLRDGAPLNPQTLAAVATGTAGALRAGNLPHPLAGYIEVSDYVESVRDSGLWKAAHTDDGIHPNRTGVFAAKVTLNDLSRFGYPG